jgi:hypothetical protein
MALEPRRSVRGVRDAGGLPMVYLLRILPLQLLRRLLMFDRMLDEHMLAL